MKRLSLLLLLFLGIANACCAQQQSVQTERPKPKPAAPVPRDALQPYYDQITNDLVNWFKQLKALAIKRGTYSPEKLLPIINEAQETLKQTDWQKIWQPLQQVIKRHTALPLETNTVSGTFLSYQMDMFPSASLIALTPLLIRINPVDPDPITGTFACPQGLDDKIKKIIAQAKADIDAELKKRSAIKLTPEYWQQYANKVKQYIISEPKEPPEVSGVREKLAHFTRGMLNKMKLIPPKGEAEITHMFAAISDSILGHMYKIAQMKGSKDAQNVISDVKTLSTQYAQLPAAKINELQEQTEEFFRKKMTPLAQKMEVKIIRLFVRTPQSSQPPLSMLSRIIDMGTQKATEQADDSSGMPKKFEKTITVDLKNLKKKINDYVAQLETIAQEYCNKRALAIKKAGLSQDVQRYIAFAEKRNAMIAEQRFVELAQAFMQLIPLDDWKQIVKNALEQVKDIVQEAPKKGENTGDE